MNTATAFVETDFPPLTQETLRSPSPSVGSMAESFLTTDVAAGSNAGAPPKKYYLSADEMRERFQRFPSMAHYKYGPTGQYNPPNAHYTEVPLTPEDVRRISTIIGRNGFYFKTITSVARVFYIWYNQDKSVVEIWGPRAKLPDAVRRVQERIERVRRESASATQDAAAKTQPMAAVSAEAADTPSSAEAADTPSSAEADKENVDPAAATAS